jgi:uncharacterized membrane protein YfhO
MRHESTVNAAELLVTATQSGLLVRAETWAPGWRAVIDGQPAAVLRVNCAFQGVWVPAGEHVVRFEYQPTGYVIGKWISLASALVVGLAGLAWMVGRRNQAGS